MLKRAAIVVLFVAGCSVWVAEWLEVEPKRAGKLGDGITRRAPKGRINYGSDHASLSECLQVVEKTAMLHTMRHVSVSAARLTKDTPNRVAGFLTKNPSGNWFECKLMVTGTRGVYWQLRYLGD